MQQIKEFYVWNIIPETLPTVIRNCPKCGKQCEFESSGNFRINANHKLLDVWLIYQCKNCNTTWNMELLSRVNPRTIKEEMYRKFMENNKELAKEYAFNIAVHRKNKITVNYKNVLYRIDGADIDYHSLSLPVGIRITCQYPIDIRMDKILSEKLGLSRTEIKKMCKNGVIQTELKEDLSKMKVKDGVILQLL
jgi:hypothetical protein